MIVLFLLQLHVAQFKPYNNNESTRVQHHINYMGKYSPHKTILYGQVLYDLSWSSKILLNSFNVSDQLSSFKSDASNTHFCRQHQSDFTHM